MSESPLSDPFIAALFTHHRERASDSLLQRLMPVPVPGTEKTVQPDYEAMKADRRAAGNIVYLPVSMGNGKVRDMITVMGVPKPTMRLILKEVCDFYELTKEEVIGQRRSKEIVRARQAAMYLCCRLTMNATPAVGRFFGGRDHTTVLHALKRIKASKDERLQDEVEILKLRVLGGLSNAEAA